MATPTLKLRRFDKTNTINSREKFPALTLSGSGTFRLNPSLSKLLKLKEGSGVALFQDETDGTEWFIANVSENGIQVRNAKDGFSFSSSQMKEEFLRSLNTEFPGGMVKVGDAAIKQDGLTLFPIVGRSLRFRTRKPKV